MFIGQTGAGKTTIARILSRAVQCRHGEFGDPCDKCLKKNFGTGIVEINASDITGIDDLRDALSGWDYEPQPYTRRRFYILDEAQMLSRSAQNLLLKYFEDCPTTTNWAICTTNPEKILPTLQRRCTKYTVPGLEEDGIRLLVTRALKKVRSPLDPTPLVEALIEETISSPSLVVGAVEKYTAGADAEEAARVEISTELNTIALCRSVVAGSWEKAAKQLREAKPEDARGIRAAVAGYLKTILLDETEFSKRTEAIADGIQKLAQVYGADDKLALAATMAALYGLCSYFKNYRLR